MISAFDRALGARIRSLRQANQLTLEALSARSGVSPSVLGSWERADRAIPVSKLYALAGNFDTYIDDLIPTEEEVLDYERLFLKESRA